LKLPPLRERTEDIALLVHHFLRKHGAANDVAHDAMRALGAYPWKGNVRELENVVERARILAREETIMMHHLPEEFQTLVVTPGSALSLEEMEHQHIIRVLRIAKDLDEAASILGIDPATLWRKRKKYNL
jgi:NtrC-family two-component system response regulator AlgB